jgi:hypothetical protein
MTATPIAQADIDGLADALDGLHLPPGQQALLAAIISTAADTLARPELIPVPSFREQFDTAFTAGRSYFIVDDVRGGDVSTLTGIRGVLGGTITAGVKPTD